MCSVWLNCMGFTAFSEIVFTEVLCYEDGWNSLNKRLKNELFTICVTPIWFPFYVMFPFHLASVAVY